jgi:hypothetical protein
MTVFDLGALAFQFGTCVFVVELLGQWFLVPAAFKFGPKAASSEEAAECLPGLSTPRRDRSLTLVYRVLPGKVCVFRPQWVGWFRSPFRICGVASWSQGRFRVCVRHAVGPFLVMLGLFIVLADGTVGFIRQGEPLSALVTAILGGAAVGVPLHRCRVETSRFAGFAEELRTELGYRTKRTNAGE